MSLEPRTPNPYVIDMQNAGNRQAVAGRQRRAAERAVSQAAAAESRRRTRKTAAAFALGVGALALPPVQNVLAVPGAAVGNAIHAVNEHLDGDSTVTVEAPAEGVRAMKEGIRGANPDLPPGAGVEQPANEPLDVPGE